MTKYKAYPEYKDSGVEWLGEIPADWEMLRHKYVASFTKGRNPISLFEQSLKNTLPYLSMECLRNNITDKYALISNDIRIAVEGQPLIIWDGSNAGEFVKGKSGILSSTMAAATLIFPLNPQYYWYLCITIEPEMRKSAIGMGIPHVNGDELKNISFGIPSIHEQKKISSFLDHETAKIDNLIETQQQLIELLKEKRQAVISHAVTKGLNPDVPMKDSGVEWLGEVPEHWSIKSYRYACLIYRGKFGHRPRNDPSLYDGDYPFIQTGDVARSSKFIETYSQTLNEKGKAVSQLFPSGTLMMAIAANIGDTAILGFEAYAPDSVVGFKPYQNIHLEFLRYSFMAALPALEQTSTQSTQANLNIDRIGAVKAVFPPLEEQLDIIDYLDNMLCSYDSIEENANQAILFLQERRTALISAAVTGKIDVRDWVAPDTQETEKIEEVAV
ncbi:restriction endonuclease subunit S [Proteus vulgaris]|uniref:restriction endonuclease subunit S n=1 Tax=Proteus vulgaris TaxID=585 RepID=UPI001D027EB1|nr:restriction endonuclease subunit S [Proteus vulgaris]MDM3563834.1 restriction endonuclease subunit S [Proteus vulgaris]